MPSLVQMCGYFVVNVLPSSQPVPSLCVLWLCSNLFCINFLVLLARCSSTHGSLSCASLWRDSVVLWLPCTWLVLALLCCQLFEASWWLYFNMRIYPDHSLLVFRLAVFWKHKCYHGKKGIIFRDYIIGYILETQLPFKMPLLFGYIWNLCRILTPNFKN